MTDRPKGYYPRQLYDMNRSLVALIQKAGELRRENEKIKEQLAKTRMALRKLKEGKK